MVCLKQLSLTAVVAFSLSETGLAAPIYAPINERALEDRAIKNLVSGIRKHGGSAFDSGLAAVGAFADFKTAFFPQPQQPQRRSLERLEDRGVKTQRLKKIASSVGRNTPKTVDRLATVLSTAAGVKTALFPQPQQPQQPQRRSRSLEELQQRAFEDYIRELYF
ncbi:unnamed protein product [Clonostachys byssicola]|uniref:Uncharacterized protein n=1 Tax=Clonostachys byssicola TaxID=160290 RepID=A0A9N9UYW8_9HYPO|nr:unnamed protein product [Clonostachys byssicola]